MGRYQSYMEGDNEKMRALGLFVLFGWIIFVLACAAPHLFRNYLSKWFKTEDAVTEKIRKAEQRLQDTLRLAKTPSSFLVDQASVMSAMVEKAPSETRIRLDFVEEEDEGDEGFSENH